MLTLRGGGEMTLRRARWSPASSPTKCRIRSRVAAAPADAAARGTRRPTSPRNESAFDPIIERVAAEQGVDAKLVRAVIQVESGYQPRARSRKGAMGLMQLMPATARQYGVTEPCTIRAANIEAGIKHLKSLLDRFAARIWRSRPTTPAKAPLQRFRGIPPYPETQTYVSTILALLVR